MAIRLTRLTFPLLLATIVMTQIYKNSVNIQNTPVSSTNVTASFQKLRDYWCNHTTAYDSNYNASSVYYYREMRSNLLNRRLDAVIDYINTGSSNDAIQAIKWPFGLALVLLLIIFISWVVFLVFLCTGKKAVTVTGGVIFGLACVKLALFLFVSLFIVIIIFIAMSEISMRRSKCQFLNVGNMILNGYYSSISGTQFAGLVAMQEAVFNFRNDAPKANNVKNQAIDILNANFEGLASTSEATLRNIADTFANSQTTNAFGQAATPASVAELTAHVNDGIRREWTEFHQLSQSVHKLGEAVFSTIQANDSPSLSSTMTTSLTSLGVFFTNITQDVHSAARSVHKTIRWSWGFAAGGYWSLFVVSVFLLIIIGLLSSGLTKESVAEVKTRDYKYYKVLLAIFGFLMVWYGILLIILLAGSGFISSFCFLIANVNDGNVRIIDRLNIQWPGNTRQLAKECLAGKTGNLWNLAALSTENINRTYLDNVQNIIRGLLNYKAFYFNPTIISSSSIAYTIANLRTIQAGITHDHTGVDEQLSFVKNSYPGFSTVRTASLTTWLCNELATNLRPNCLAFDTTAAPSNVGTQTTYLNHTVANNLIKYVTSENLLLNNMIQSLDGSTTTLTPAQAYRNSKLVLDNRQASVDAIRTAFASTIAPFAQYDVQATHLFDCRSVKKELAILEDHYCFELNYWVFIITVLSAISLLLLFIIGWSYLGLICELDTDETTVSIPAREIGADINERELAPRY